MWALQSRTGHMDMELALLLNMTFKPSMTTALANSAASSLTFFPHVLAITLALQFLRHFMLAHVLISLCILFISFLECSSQPSLSDIFYSFLSTDSPEPSMTLWNLYYYYTVSLYFTSSIGS